MRWRGKPALLQLAELLCLPADAPTISRDRRASGNEKQQENLLLFILFHIGLSRYFRLRVFLQRIQSAKHLAICMRSR